METTPSASLLRRNPLFRKFLTASTVSLLGTNIFDVVFPLYVYARTHSVFDLALANVALLLPFLLAAPFTAYSVDYLDRRRLLLGADICSGILLLFFVLYDFTGASALWPILVTVFLLKTCAILYETITTFQLIPAMVRPADLPAANSWFLSSMRLVQVVGPALGGALMVFLGFYACIAANIASFAATLWFVRNSDELRTILRDDCGASPGMRKSITQLPKEFAENIAFILRSPLFRAFLPLMFLWNLSPLIPGTPTLVYYFTVKRGMSALEYGAVVSMIGLTGIVGYAAASYFYDRRGFKDVFIGSALLQAAVGTFALFFYAFPGPFAVIFAISRGASSVLNMGTFLLRQTRIPKARAGSVNTALRMMFMSAAPASALAQGFLIEYVGVGFSLVLGAACLWGTLRYAKQVTEFDEAAPAPIRKDEAA